ncbi:ABC transporter ATP-binding protein [Leptolyngbya sp. 15MV]|nr:ABC transporter ATP-binding protein [Leptolyngbya sp. 15MV]
MTALLQLGGVTKRFGPLTAVDDVSLDVRQGEFVALIGANGAGKTTLFAMIAGHHHPTAGSILFDGRPLGRSAPDARSRAGIARTFQIVRPFQGLTVLENVATAAWFGATGRGRSRAEAESVAREALGAVGMREEAERSPRDLPLARLKRLEVARALATAPRLLLLDEVLSGLTPAEVEDAAALLRAVHARHGLTIIMVEHVLAAVMRLCDRVCVLHHGRLIADGTPAAISANAAVAEAYLGGRSLVGHAA